MRTWRLVSLLSILALVLAACGSQGNSPSAEESEEPPASGAAPSEELPGEPTAGGTLVFAGSRLSSSLDPVLTSDGESFRRSMRRCWTSPQDRRTNWPPS